MKRWWLSVPVVVVTIMLVSSMFLLQGTRPSPVVLRGSLFVSDAGRSHGGFEYNAEWNATLTVDGAIGSLKLVLHVGLSDALTRHEYRITDFVQEPGKVSLKIEGRPVVVVWTERDEIWGRIYDRHYIASWGSDAPLEELRGTISPAIFSGLVGFWYVELRLR